MNGYWSDVVSGLTTALVWAVLLWLWTRWRDRKILREVQNSIVDFPNVGFNRMKFGYTPNPVDVNTFTVRNQTPWPIVIREVVLTFDGKTDYGLGYLGKYATEFDSHVQLKAYTSSEWGAPFKSEHGEKLTAGRVLIEYNSPLGATRLKTITLSAEQLQTLNDAIARSRRACEQRITSGSPETL